MRTHLFRVLHRRIRARDVIAGALERREGVRNPAPLQVPARNRSHVSGTLQQIAADRGVVRQLHLINGDAVGRQRDRALDALLPVLVGFPEHPRDQVDVDLRKIQRACVLVNAEDLRRLMRAAVQIEDPVVEVLDAETEPRHAEPAQRREF